LPRRWRARFVPEHAVTSERAAVLSGVLESFAAFVVLVIWYSHSVTHWVASAFDSALRNGPEAQVPGQAIGSSALVLLVPAPFHLVYHVFCDGRGGPVPGGRLNRTSPAELAAAHPRLVVRKGHRAPARGRRPALPELTKSNWAPSYLRPSKQPKPSALPSFPTSLSNPPKPATRSLKFARLARNPNGPRPASSASPTTTTAGNPRQQVRAPALSFFVSAVSRWVYPAVRSYSTIPRHRRIAGIRPDLKLARMSPSLLQCTVP